MKVYENVSLREYNTFGIDVRCRRMVVVEPSDSGERVAECLADEQQGVLILGGGSNMVFLSDYSGTVLHLSNEQPSNQTIIQSGDTITAWGGMTMDTLVQWTLDHGLYGMENLSAIPGTVGASAVQNVGAYGAEAKDFILSVEAFDLIERRLRTFANEECRFAYRDSLFKHQSGRYLILHVTYRLSRTFSPNLGYKALESLPHATAQQLREAITDLRWQKLPRPEEHGSAGSFFKNPVVDEETYLRLKSEFPDMPEAHRVENGEGRTENGYKLSAGWLIDRAGWKGRTQGRAGVWPKNALVLYNNGGCTGDEVRSLAQAIQEDIKNKFGIILQPEAIII